MPCTCSKGAWEALKSLFLCVSTISDAWHTSHFMHESLDTTSQYHESHFLVCCHCTATVHNGRASPTEIFQIYKVDNLGKRCVISKTTQLATINQANLFSGKVERRARSRQRSQRLPPPPPRCPPSPPSWRRPRRRWQTRRAVGSAPRPPRRKRPLLPRQPTHAPSCGLPQV